MFGYNLELFGGRMHSDVWFGLAWGSFPALVGAYAQHWTLSVAAVAVAAAAFFLSMGQRALSTPARTLRRRVSAVSVQITFSDGRQAQLGRSLHSRRERIRCVRVDRWTHQQRDSAAARRLTATSCE